MTRPPLSRTDRILIWLVACLFSLLWIVAGARSLNQGRTHDFQYSYGAARLILEGKINSLYGSALVSGPQQGLPYDRPAAAALLYVPFALLPPDAAYAFYIAVWIVLLLICWAWGYVSFGPFAVLLASLFIPANLGIPHGQDCILYLALLIWSYSLAKQQRPLAAGAALGLMVLKFHLVLLWPVALALTRRWKMLAGFAATSILLAAVSVAMVGISGTRQYIDVLLRPSAVSPSPDFMVGFAGALTNLGIDSKPAMALLAAAILALFVWGVRQASLVHLYALTTAAGLTLVPHAYGYDAARLLLPIWLVFFYSRWRVARTAAMLMATPVAYVFSPLGKPWAAVGSLAMLAFFSFLAIEGRVQEKQLRPEPDVKADVQTG